jgi:hypothetical protein
MDKKPNSVETICTLMMTVGKEFFQKDPVKSKSCYLKIEELLQSGNIVSKEKVIILDLKELKEKEAW